MSNLALILDKMAEYCSKPELRAGQSLMNAIYDVDLELYNKITGTDADCFYVDSKMSKTWDVIEEHYSN